MPPPRNPPPKRSDFSLFRAAPLALMDSVVDVRAASILHVAAGDRFIALATSSNTLLLLAAADDGADGTDGRPPLVRQIRWFSGPDKGVAAMQLHDEAGLLVASHDGSAFILPMHRLMHRPPSPTGTPSGELLLVLPGGLEIPCDASSACGADEGQELIAIHAAAMYSRTAGGISSCALWHGFPGGGGGAVLGSLDGSLHILGVRGREQLRCVPVGAAISRLWLVADAAAGTADSALDEGVGCVLVRLLQGTYLRMELREPFELLPVPLAWAHPRAELWVQRSSSHGELLLLHTARDGRLQAAHPPRAHTHSHARTCTRVRVHTHEHRHRQEPSASLPPPCGYGCRSTHARRSRTACAIRCSCTCSPWPHCPPPSYSEHTAPSASSPQPRAQPRARWRPAAAGREPPQQQPAAAGRAAAAEVGSRCSSSRARSRRRGGTRRRAT